MIKGTHFNLETRMKMRLSHLGVPLSKKHAFNIGLARRGTKLSETAKEKCRVTKLGAKNPMYGKPLSEEHRHKISVSNSGKIFSIETRLKISKSKMGNLNPCFGRPCLEYTKKRLSLTHKGKKRPIEWRMNMSKSQKGRLRGPSSEECKKHHREAVAKLLITRKLLMVGVYEKEVLDRLESEMGYTILRQYPTNGYFLDGYIPDINLVIEVDEPHHFNFLGNLRQKDIKRQEEIITSLNCDFIRFKEVKQNVI